MKSIFKDSFTESLQSDSGIVEGIHKTSSTTLFWLYKLLQIPFALRNAAQSFQKLIDKVLRGLPFVYAYIADILNANKSIKEHNDHSDQVFQRMSHFGLRINMVSASLAPLSLNP